MEALRQEYQTVRTKRVALGNMDQKDISCYFKTFFSPYTHLNIFFPSLEMRRKASPWQRNLGYPLVMIALLALTVYII